MKKSFTKITATTLAVLTLILTFCIAGSAGSVRGGAMVYLGDKTVHFADPAEAWAVFAAEEGSAAFQLMGDWKADENGSFGEGKGFKDGAIALEYRRESVIIDLNGYDVDRGLTEERENGSVFYFYACSQIYLGNNSKLWVSEIRGGNNKNDGGAFTIYGTDLSMRNIKIEGNAARKGGAFYIDECDYYRGAELSDVIITACTLTGNKATTGGAIYIENSNRVQIYDTTITGNLAKNDAGIHTEVSGLYSTHIFLGGKVTIADNIAEEEGTGLTLDENFFRKVSVSYDLAKPLSDESRIVILSKTDDKTLRITTDSPEHHFDCYEYENDDYTIVTKGSGDGKYLAIKKA